MHVVWCTLLRVATRHDVACSAMLAASPLQHLPDGKAQFLRRTFSRANDAFVASPISSSDRANVSASNATCSSINSCKHFNGTDTAMTKTACVSQAESRALVYGCMPHVACIRYLRCMRQIAWCVLRLCSHIPSHGTAQSHPARLGYSTLFGGMLAVLFWRGAELTAWQRVLCVCFSAKQT